MTYTISVISSRTRETVDLPIEYPDLPVIWTGTASDAGIDWDVTPAVKSVILTKHKTCPKRLTGGAAMEDAQLGKFVEFRTPKIRVKIANKPDLAALWEWRRGKMLAEQAARNDFWAAERESDGALLMAKIPAGSVSVKLIGSAPDPWEAGMSVGVWQAEDGRTFAGDPDEWAEGAGHIAETRLAKCAEHYAEQQRREADRKAKIAADNARYAAEQLATVVPATALAAYRRYRGDEEKAWEQGDEGAWAQIRKYRDAIEAQKLAFPSADVA